MTSKVNVAPDVGILTSFLRAGASFFRVYLDEERVDGELKIAKRPALPGWQTSPTGPITTESDLRATIAKGAPAFGFHPETIGAWVIDIDGKNADRNGWDTLRALIENSGLDPKIMDWPEAYSDTPNGRHLYFDRDSVPEDLRISVNGLAPGLDLRGHHSGGWLVAPGSIGYSQSLNDWRIYTWDGPSGGVLSLPKLPIELANSLRIALQKKNRGATPVATEKPPLWVDGSPFSPDADTPRAELYAIARRLARSEAVFVKLLEAYAPIAARDGKHYYTGDITGMVAGKSCVWTPGKGVIKDFAEDQALDWMGWLVRFRKLDYLTAARTILHVAGAEDPTHGLELMGSSNPESKPDDQIAKIYPLTDMGNAERLAVRLRGKAYWLTDSAQWLVYESGFFKRQADAKVHRIAKDVVRSIKNETKLVPEDQEEAYMKWAAASEGIGHFRAMIELVKHEPGITAVETDFDTHLDLLPVANGVANLKTAELLPHSPDYMFTLRSEVRYKSDARCPQWLKFMDQITVGRKDLAKWLRVWLGHSLSGRTEAQRFPVFYGSGGNGKSVLLSVIGAIMGDFAGQASPTTLTNESRTDTMRADLAALKGKRLVMASETKPGATLDTALVKEITGGEPVTCRFLHGQFFTYRPTYKVVLSTNHKPKIKGQDEGIWRRLVYVPFDLRLSDETADRDLKNKLLEEREGILLWLLSGAAEWYAAGMTLPESSTAREATAEYREDEDIIGSFLRERCIRNEGVEIKAETFFQAFREWASERGETKWTWVAVSRMLDERGGVRRRRTGQGNFIEGITLKSL